MKRFQNIHPVLTALVLAALSCARRDGELMPRNNPYDAGGENWTENLNPAISVSLTQNSSGAVVWFDFNFTDSTGSIQFVLHGYDSNEIFDTLTYSLYLSVDSHAIYTQPVIHAVPPPPASPAQYSGADSVIIASSVKLNTRYYYRAIVTDAHGGSAAVVGFFLSPAGVPPLPPSGLTAAGYEGHVLLSWNASADADSYAVYRATAPQGPYLPVAAMTHTSWNDESPEQIIYYYKVASINEHGGACGKETVWAKAYDGTLPTPYLVTASDNLPYISVTWSGGYANQYIVFRSTNPDSGFIKRAIVSAAYFNDTVSSPSTYCYRIASYAAGGRSSALSPSACGHRARTAAPIGLTATSGTYSDFVRLTWTPAGAATSYVVYRWTVYAYDTLAIDTVTAAVYDDHPPTDSLYYYAVAVLDPSAGPGEKSVPAYGQIMTMPKFSFDTSDITAEYVDVTWVYDYNASYFKLYRAADSTHYSLLDSLPGSINYFYDSTMSHDSVYSYRLVRAEGTEESRPAVVYNVRLKPAVPESLAAVEDVTSVRLSWRRAAGADGYRVYRASADTNAYYYFYYDIQATLTSQADTTWIDSTVRPDSSYSYKIGAFNSSGISMCLAVGQVRMLRSPLTPSIKAAGKAAYIEVICTPNAYGARADGFIIYRSLTADSASFAAIDTIQDTLYHDSVATLSAYYYRAAAYNAAGLSSQAATYSAVSRTAPIPPDSVWASKGLLADSIRVWWTRCDGATSYNIYRSSTTSFSAVEATVTDTFFTDAVSSDSIYSYKVKAVNSFTGESSLSSATGRGYRLPMTVPDTMRSVSVTGNTSGIRISWSMPSGPVVEGYFLYRMDPGASQYTEIQTFGADETSYTDPVPLRCPGNLYTYIISAFNRAGKGAGSVPRQDCRP